MMKIETWHVPSLSTYRLAPPKELLHVIFMQRQSIASRKRVIESLAKGDKEWALQYDPDARSREMKEVPWIRDTWPSSEVIFAITGSAPDYKSFVLVDSGWEDSTVIAAHWADDEHGKQHLYAARVQIDIANVLLTLLDDGKVSTLEEVLGKAEYEETKVDFYKDQRPPTGEKRKVQPYEPPAFLPKDLALNKTTIEIVALLELTDEQLETLGKIIQSGTKRATRSSASTVDVKIHKWEGKSPSRFELRQLYDWIYENTPEDDRRAPAFFIDNFLEDEDDGPRVMAVTTDNIGYEHPVRMFPLLTKRVLPYFEEKHASSKTDDTEKNGNIWKQETLPPTERPMTFRGGSEMGCPVFYLTPFTPEQERTIRAALSGLGEVEEGTDFGNIFAYHGYLFPSSSATHTIQDLADLFQKSDPRSPTYDPDYSTLRLSEYPSDFVACDERVLDPDNPTVIMASSLDFSNYPLSDDKLGWLVGTKEAAEAHIMYVNLDIANMGPDECFDECKALWLNDLTAHKREAEERRAAQEVHEQGGEVVVEREEWVGMENSFW